VTKRAAALLAALLAALAIVVGVGAGAAHAADGTAIKGVIKDEAGAPIAGVALTVANTSGFSQTATTGADGTWEVPLTEPGTYSVTIDVATLPEGATLRDPDVTSRTVTVFSSPKTVLFPIGSGERETESTLNRALQLTVDGLLFGLIIALAGVGLSMIYGTTGLTNFSHGELVTLGALVTFLFNNVLELPFVLSAALAIVVCAFVGGYLQDKGIWQRLRKRGTGLIAMMIVSIGLGITVRYIYLFFYGGNTEPFREYAGQAGLEIGPVSITPKSMFAAVVGIAALLAVTLWLLRSRMGKASRAVADNPALASASGIDVERVIAVVWTLGAALAALGGIVYALNNGVSWFFGFQILLLVFAGVTLGGLGTVLGAIVGSLIVGLMIQLSTLFVPPELKNVGALVILILILLVRPQGILGRRERVG
jgi:branched-chain amino acid transport system permease protein